MNKFLLGVLSTAILLVGIFFFVTQKEEKQELEYNTALIQQQIR